MFLPGSSSGWEVDQCSKPIPFVINMPTFPELDDHVVTTFPELDDYVVILLVNWKKTKQQ